MSKGVVMARTLITGGAGFVGSHIVDSFLHRGDKVLVVDDLTTGKRQNVPDEVKFHRVGVQSTQFTESVRAFQPDIIVHAAAQASVAVSMSDPKSDAEINIIGGINVAQVARDVQREQLIYITTGGALYGKPEYAPSDEKHPIQPVSGYGLSKWTLERYFDIMLPATIDLKVLRLANVYGPRQDPKGEAGVVAIFASALVEGMQITIDGDGNQTRDFVFVADVARAVRLAAETQGSIVANIGTGQGTSINELVSHMGSLVDWETRPVHGASRLGDIRNVSLDGARAKKVFGWEPIVTLPEGLAITIGYFCKGC